MSVKLLQSALNAAIQLDIRNAEEHLDMTLAEHAEAFGKIAPNLAKALVAIGNLNVEKMQAEMN
tara:strand:+ start:288 stop:479 length:192 start_codon:yes stop_codon:yes gene_type:complete